MITALFTKMAVNQTPYICNFSFRHYVDLNRGPKIGSTLHHYLHFPRFVPKLMNNPGSRAAVPPQRLKPEHFRHPDGPAEAVP
jgi:hypothetical protein